MSVGGAVTQPGIPHYAAVGGVRPRLPFSGSAPASAGFFFSHLLSDTLFLRYVSYTHTHTKHTVGNKSITSVSYEMTEKYHSFATL